MTPWSYRSQEEQALLNPAFCANLLWHAAFGTTEANEGGSRVLSFEEAFLILPFVLHRETREALPRDTRTSLAVWLDNNPLVRGWIAVRSSFLVSFTKEGILFGGIYGFIRIEKGCIYADQKWKRSVNRSLRASSDEVRECAKKAEFIGKWLAQSGSTPTVLALIGVRP